MLEIRKAHEDIRGELFEVHFNGKEIGILVSTKKSFVRGGHYHKNEQEMYVIKGSFDFRTMVLGKPETDHTSVLKEGRLVTIAPHVVHLMTAKEDSLFFETMRQGYEVTNYTPFRKIVEERMKERRKG